MELLFSASFIASFFAGVAALFAPCCITVLLPAYLASIFKERATVYLMTFVFFLGLLTVFLPLGLGAAFLTQFFSQYHNTIFLVGAIFLIFLGFTLLLGKHLSFNTPVHPELKSVGFFSVFVLGVFSGVATTCCAPVLAGVLTLSALPGSFVLGGVYTLAYVLGMVIPLFIIATFLDKAQFTQKFFVFRKSLSYNLLGQKVYITYANLLSSLMFLVLGVIILFLAQTNQLTSHASYQITLNIYLSKFVKIIGGVTSLLPEFVWAAVFVGAFLLITKKAFNQIKKLK